MATHELVAQESLVLKPPSTSVTPTDLLEMAARNGAPLEALKEFMELKERHEANEARKAFVHAKALFSAEEIHITRDRENKQYGSRYTSLGNLVNTVRPYLGKYGFDIRWEVDQSNGIKVSCVLTHSQGHSERVTMLVPVDTSGAKNPVQQIKSSITYARNLTFEAVCGLASTDGTVNLDDDANGAGNGSQAQGNCIPDEEYVVLMDGIENAADADELKRLYFAALKVADEAKDAKAKSNFGKAKNKRWREIHARG